MRLFKKNAKGTHLYSRSVYKRGGEGGLYPGALKTGMKYSLANGLAYIRGLKSGRWGGGALK